MRELHQSGFTIRDLIVTICVLSVLLALLMPAVQITRAPSRRTSCRNNLKQLGLALHSYHDAHKVFPPGITSWGAALHYVGDGATCEQSQLGRTTAFLHLLPFLEERIVYRAYNSRVASCHPANTTTLNHVIGTFLCPSNPGYLTHRQKRDTSASSDYVLSLGGNALLTPAAVDSPGYPAAYRPGRGVFNVNSSTKFANITDGTSYTFVAGEGLSGVPAASGSGCKVVEQSWGDAYVPSPNAVRCGSVFAATAHDAWFDAAGKLMPPGNAVAPWSLLPMQVASPSHVQGTVFPRSYPQGIEDPRSETPPPMLPVSVSPFRSAHPEVCYFLFADGTVRGLAPSIDPATYVSLSIIAGGEPPE